MVHPHDFDSDLEPWTVRMTYLAREIRKAGHEVALVHHTLGGEPGPPRYLDGTDILAIPLVRYSRTLFRKNKILTDLASWADIVHFQKCLSYTALPTIRAAYKVGIPVHYDWDDWEYEIYNYNPMERIVGRSINRIERAIPNLVDTVSVASDGLRKLCIDLGFPQELIVKVPVGADTARFNPDVDARLVRERHDIDGPIVLYVGQLHGAQYLEHLLEAFVEIRDRHPDATLLVVGGGDRFGELHLLGEQLGINDSTVFTGPVPHHEIPLYMAAADVAVASFEDTPQTRCKSPLKVVEYLAMGKAIVGTSMGEVEHMLGGGAGLLYPPGDIAALARCVARVLHSPDLRRELETAARNRSEAVYNWRNSAASLVEAYEMARMLHSGRRRNLFSTKLKSSDGAPIAAPKKNAKTSLPPWWPRRIVNFVEHHRSLVGIFHGERAFRGPGLVQLDVTNNCNNDCIACWCNSPFLGDQRMTPEVKRQHLPLHRVIELLDELWAMGTREIYMAGGGEPFMHPDIMEIVRKVKSLGFTLFINTNFTLVDRQKAQELMDLGVDHLTVSMWAGTPETYSLVHPNKTEETFHEICDVLSFINQNKQGRPFVKLYQVISCLNYHEIPEMARLTRATGCESVEFTLVDTMPGATESLLLNEAERLHTLELLEQTKGEADGIELFNIELFERRISNADSIHGEHDSDFIHSIPCTIGWTFSRILPDGNVNACLKAHRIPVGNILNQSFFEVWNSPEQRSFRRHTNVLEKKDPFFRQIGNDPNAECGCVKSCDDIGRNLHTIEAIESLSATQRRILRRAARKLGPEVRGAD